MRNGNFFTGAELPAERGATVGTTEGEGRAKTSRPVCWCFWLMHWDYLAFWLTKTGIIIRKERFNSEYGCD